MGVVSQGMLGGQNCKGRPSQLPSHVFSYKEGYLLNFSKNEK